MLAVGIAWLVVGLVLGGTGAFLVLKVFSHERHLALLFVRVERLEAFAELALQDPTLVCEHGIMRANHCADCVAAADAEDD